MTHVVRDNFQFFISRRNVEYPFKRIDTGDGKYEAGDEASRKGGYPNKGIDTGGKGSLYAFIPCRNVGYPFKGIDTLYFSRHLLNA